VVWLRCLGEGFGRAPGPNGALPAPSRPHHHPRPFLHRGGREKKARLARSIVPGQMETMRDNRPLPRAVTRRSPSPCSGTGVQWGHEPADATFQALRRKGSGDHPAGWASLRAGGLRVQAGCLSPGPRWQSGRFSVGEIRRKTFGTSPEIPRNLAPAGNRVARAAVPTRGGFSTGFPV